MKCYTPSKICHIYIILKLYVYVHICGEFHVDKYLSGFHELIPMSFSDRWILKFPYSLQRSQSVFNGRLQLHVRIPSSHFLIQHSYFLSKFFTFNIHVFNINLPPWSRLPIFNTRMNDENIIPQLLKKINSDQNHSMILNIYF